MTHEPEQGPFRANGRAEVHLPNAPLIRVLCQVTWLESTPVNMGFARIVEAVAKELSDQYPMPSKVQPVQFEIDPTGQMRQQDVHPVHKFSSVSGEWSVYLSTTFLTIETSNYTSRDDILSRFERALTVLESAVSIPAINRMGFRYVNRISDPVDYSQLEQLVISPLLGATLIPLPKDVERQHAISQSQFVAPQGSLVTKWAFLPPNFSHDPTIEPIGDKSWVFDLDAFAETREPFDVSAIIHKTRELSSLAYAFFRWAVKDSFIERFGGKL
jgi:uncharacterized protein (TIGR04255 family)